MNKTEFARSLSEVNKLSYKAGAEATDLVLDHILRVVSSGQDLNLTGVVKFTVKEVKARTARNPQTGDPVEVPATRQVRASAGATLKSAVKA